MRPAIVGIKLTGGVAADGIEEELASVAKRHGLDVVKMSATPQDEIDELRKQLETAKAESDVYRSKFELLASLSHDLRTPLGSIIGFTELLLAYREKRLPPKRDEVEDIKSLSISSKHLLSVINDLVDYVKLEAGKLDIYPEAFNVHSLIESVADSVKESSESGVLLDIGDDPCIEMTSDPLRLRQVLITLLMRIVKFCEDKIILSVSCENSEWMIFRIESKIGKTKYTYWGFEHGLEWPVCEGLCQLMKGTITKNTGEESIEILLKLPIHLDIPTPEKQA